MILRAYSLISAQRFLLAVLRETNVVMASQSGLIAYKASP